MKKKLILCVLLIMAVVVALLLHFNNSEDMVLQKSYMGKLTNSLKNEYFNIELNVKEGNLKVGTKVISYVFENNGTDIVLLGGGYSIETLKGNVWYEIPFKEHVTFTAEALGLNPGKKFQGKIDLDLLKYKLPKGKYRLIQDFSSSKSGARLAAEFTLH